MCVDINTSELFVRQNGVMASSPNQMRSRYLRWDSIGLVFLGGALGVLAREALMLAVPNVGALPVAVMLANIFGALLLGLLLESMGSRGEAVDRHQSLRLLLGTGALGGFTTYSALAQAVLVIWSGGAAWLAVGYGIGTLFFGALATWCGVLLGTVLGRRRARRQCGRG